MLQIHKKIEISRINAGLTQDQIATKLNIKRSTYQYWEKKTPAIDKIESVAEVLGFQKDYFFVTPDEYFVLLEDVDEKKKDSAVKTDLVQATIPVQEKSDWLSAFIEEKEARRKEAEQRADHAEKEKDRLLTIIENNLTELLKVTAKIDTNLKEAQEDLNEVEFGQRAQHTVMIHSLERIENKPGALQKELSTLERAALPKDGKSGKIVNAGKKGK